MLKILKTNKSIDVNYQFTPQQVMIYSSTQKSVLKLGFNLKLILNKIFLIILLIVEFIVLAMRWLFTIYNVMSRHGM
jgi:hypothetical protein